MKQQNPRVVGCPTSFPGKLVASLCATGDNDTQGGNSEPGSVVSGVTLYCSVPSSGLPGGVRLNLFAELSGTLDRVASVIVPVGFSGGVMTVSGFMVDAWHVFEQALSPNQVTKIALASLSCCAEPAVRIRPELTPFAFSAEDVFNALETVFPMTPWGTGAEGSAGHSTLTGASDTIVLPENSRILYWEGIGSAADGQLAFMADARSVIVALGQTVQRHGYPAGSLVADQIVGTDITFASVDWVN